MRPITRRAVLGGTATLAAAGVLSSCASPVPEQQAEVQYPPIGEFVRAEGLAVHYWRAVPDDPALASRRPAVLVHGASGNLRDWTFGPGRTIAETRPVIAFDRPGFGYTTRQKTEDAWDPAVQARLLRAASAELGIEKPILVGHSWGAALALAWALDAPEGVSGVVPVSGVTMPYQGAARVFRYLGVNAVVAWLYTEYIKSTMDNGGVERFLERVFRPQQPPEGYANYVGAPLALREATLEANAMDIQNLNIALQRMAPAYPELRVPVRIVHGGADFIPADKHAAGLAETLPDAELAILPGVGHMAHHVATGAIVDALDTIDRGSAA
jgi:pimeloyl-ACP methyl ester carboxylesterase